MTRHPPPAPRGDYPARPCRAERSHDPRPRRSSRNAFSPDGSSATANVVAFPFATWGGPAHTLSLRRRMRRRLTHLLHRHAPDQPRVPAEARVNLLVLRRPPAPRPIRAAREAAGMQAPIERRDHQHRDMRFQSTYSLSMRPGGSASMKRAVAGTHMTSASGPTMLRFRCTSPPKTSSFRPPHSARSPPHSQTIQTWRFTAMQVAGHGILAARRPPPRRQTPPNCPGNARSIFFGVSPAHE